MKKEITFDSAVRGLIVLAVTAASILLVRRLEAVLLPFFVAWLLAYLIYPLVTFFQYRLHLHFRLLSIVLALVVVFAGITGLLVLVIPPTISEVSRLHGVALRFIQDWGQSPVAAQVDCFLRENFNEDGITQLLQNKDVMGLLQTGFAQTWALITNVLSVVRWVVSLTLVLLYLFFILMDYEEISDGLVRLFPARQRGLAGRILDDVKNGMQAYFRGQGLIAFLVGVLFSIGFSIVGLPMAVGLGMFIGFLNLVPYLQTLGAIPAILLALLQSLQTGQNFWVILFYCFLVFLVVQTLQDVVLTPRIMGKMMGLKPAVILLSLSVWGSLMGFIGLIIALPLTSLLISYYRLYLLKDSGLELTQTGENEAEK